MLKQQIAERIWGVVEGNAVPAKFREEDVPQHLTLMRAMRAASAQKLRKRSRRLAKRI